MLKRAAAGTFIAAWFLIQSWPGIFRDFTEDDLMNMYFAWILPAKRLVLGNLTPFTSVYRPVGSAFYHLMYLAAGFHPVPFRIAAYALMLLNLWLVYRVTLAVTGSFEMGALCALIFSFHKRLFGLLVNGGTIYDILCCTFFCLAFWFYAAARKRGVEGGWRMPAFLGLYTLALNSKEMAASLPLILLAYELIYFRDKLGWRWLWERRAIWTAAVVTVIAFEMKTGRESSFFGVHEYDQVFTAARYFSTAAPLVSQLLFLRESALGPAAALIIVAALFAIAAGARNRAMLLGSAILVLAMLPVNFIVYRGFFVMYIPLIGFALWTSAGLSAALGKRLAFPVVLMAAAAAIFFIERQDRSWSFDVPDLNQDRIRALRLELERDRIPRRGRVLLVHSPFDAGNYDALFLARLAFHDPEVALDTGPGSGKYDLVIR